MLRFLLILLGLTLMGCANDEKQASRSHNPYQNGRISAEDLNENQTKQRDLAIQARDKMFQALSTELTNSMTKSGPASSISVCKSKAPLIAKQVSSELNVNIGRTSFKLRNPDNSSPAWADEWVKKKLMKEVIVELPTDKLGVLMPIKLQPACITCHGKPEQMRDEVLTSLKENYPEDQATGFAVGDVRGYFWVEVPAVETKQ